MKKITETAFCVLFILACVIPLGTMKWFGEDKSNENRTLSEKPVLIKEDRLNTDFFDDVNSYVSDHFSFRSVLVGADSAVKEQVFHTSANSNVVIGKDDWLFFSKTLGDYDGSARLTAAELQKISQTIRLMEEYCSEKGCRFLFAVVPNKNTVYPEKMSPFYIKSEKDSNLTVLTEELKNDSGFINLTDFLADADDVYHKRDSHWNNKGALVGYTALMNRIGAQPVDYSGVSVSEQRVWVGDLDKMLYSEPPSKDVQYIFDYEYSYTYTSSFRGEEDIFINTENGDASGSLLMFRDSFANALLPFMAEQFHTARFSRATPYNLVFDEGQYDTVIVELVERNIPNMLTAAPVMPAPERAAPAVEDSSSFVDVKIRRLDDFTHVYGALDGSLSAEEIYVACDGKTFQAFPIYESKLLGESSETVNGFSAYLPGDINAEAIRLMIKDGDGWLELNTKTEETE